MWVCGRWEGSVWVYGRGEGSLWVYGRGGGINASMEGERDQCEYIEGEGGSMWVYGRWRGINVSIWKGRGD